jgi:TRAP-type C4-dicarboxylate transport system permease small subunit
MSIGLVFWVLMLLWIISVIGRRLGGANYPWAEPAGDFLILILFFLLGWRVFGFIIQG